METYLKETEINGVKTYRTYAKIESVKPDPQNPRDISDEKLKDLKDFVSKYGELKPVLVDIRPEKLGQLIGGNQRLKAYTDLGKTELWVQPIDPMTDAQAFEIGTIDNMEFGQYVEDKLKILLQQYHDEIDFSKLGVDLETPPSFEDLLKQFNKDKDVAEDQAPEVSPEPARSELGKVYQLGRHRLMCGDATKIEDVEKLMNGQKADMVFTDPPYGIAVKMDNSTGASAEEILGDKDTVVAARSFKLALNMNIPMIFWGANHYALDARVPNSKCWIAWNKQESNNHIDQADCELARTNLDSPARQFHHLWAGFRRDSEVGEARVHPTQKPIKLIADILTHFKAGDTILDLFGGSGSTLVACEQTNRTCYMMELDPKYVDVIRKRYAKFIGKETEWENTTPAISGETVITEETINETPLTV